jgi:phosphoenolpyruvate-protein kinase (PTS system EI component)
MAADPMLLTLLVGLGLREFSMAATAIPLAKQVLRGLDTGDATRLARQALRARTATEVEQALIRYLAPKGEDAVRVKGKG